MCCGCFKDEGEIKIDNPLVRECLKAIEALYELHPTGGYLHCVTDDNNVDDEDIEWSLNAITKNEYEEDEHSLALNQRVAILMQKMTRDERVSVLGLFDGCWGVN